MAKEERRSKSDIFREKYDAYKFKKTLTKLQKAGREKFLALGIETKERLVLWRAKTRSTGALGRLLMWSSPSWCATFWTQQTDGV